MKLAEALSIVQTSIGDETEVVSVYLACGFTPLHLSTFLQAELQLRLTDRSIRIGTGLFDAMPTNLQQMASTDGTRGVVAFEWSDFDSRLGLRNLGGWGPSVLSDIVSGVRENSDLFFKLLTKAAQSKALVISFPTLPFAPVSFHQPAQAGLWQLQINEIISALANKLGGLQNVTVLNSQELDIRSPLSERFDVKGHLATGFPYKTAHAACLAEMLASLVITATPKKGLITDLDDTLWRGLVGEDGVDGICWDLDSRSQAHGLYQQLLSALNDSGVLLAIASKNDSEVVAKALQRDDLIVNPQHFFPVEVNWTSKSQSIARILNKWKIGPESVVFVDDSPFELEEVKAAFPEMDCLLFPRGDDQAMYDLLWKLRALFGKPALHAEDAIRQESIRTSSAFLEDTLAADPDMQDRLLKSLEAQLTVQAIDNRLESRALELVNKTNQFNLNGRRLSAGDFNEIRRAPNAVSRAVTYRDKYGPLGTIAVMVGSIDGPRFTMTNWVMSCRAFSRRIEYMCLDYLFEDLGVEEIVFQYSKTERNGPFNDFLSKLLTSDSDYRVTRETFANRKPALYHVMNDETKTINSKDSVSVTTESVLQAK